MRFGLLDPVVTRPSSASDSCFNALHAALMCAIRSDRVEFVVDIHRRGWCQSGERDIPVSVSLLALVVLGGVLGF